MSLDTLKKKLIEEIKKEGFPVGFIHGEADGYTGYYVENEKKIVALEYAEEAKTLTDISLTNLAALLEYGVRPDDIEKEKKEEWQMILEYRGYALENKSNTKKCEGCKENTDQAE